MNTENHPIILFDGVCNLCNGFVQFVIRHDKHRQFMFGSLQSTKAQEIMKSYAPDRSNDLTTIVLLERGNLFTQSTAVLKIVKGLDSGLSLFYVFMIVPKFLRDWIYRLVARSRYKIFGKRDSCMVPTPELKKRFIDQDE